MIFTQGKSRTQVFGDAKRSKSYKNIKMSSKKKLETKVYFAIFSWRFIVYSAQTDVYKKILLDFQPNNHSVI